MGEWAYRSTPAKPGRAVVVTGEDDVLMARYVAMGIATELGFARVAVHQIGTSVTELGTNLVFHAARGGEIRIGVLVVGERVGLEIVARDDGPGIVDVDAALTDGFSTAGGLGGGLSGVRRLMDAFEIESSPGRGTTVRARRWK